MCLMLVRYWGTLTFLRLKFTRRKLSARKLFMGPDPVGVFSSIRFSGRKNANEKIAEALFLQSSIFGNSTNCQRLAARKNAFKKKKRSKEPLNDIECVHTFTKNQMGNSPHHHMHVAHTILLLQTSTFDRAPVRGESSHYVHERVHDHFPERRWLWDSKPCFWDQIVYTHNTHTLSSCTL